MQLNVILKEDAIDIITTFIKDRVALAGVDGVVLGLSGGLDSAVVTAICVRALGPERVRTLHMPAGEGNHRDLKDSEDLAGGLNIHFRVVDISEPLVSICGHWEGDVTPSIRGNIAARLRMVILFTEANRHGLMVAGTSNKSELLTGYYTKFGDGASDILPLGDLYKTQVRQLAGKLDIPTALVEKPPSAGLVEGQTDEDDLGIDYPTLDRILLGYELGLSPDEIAGRLGIDVEMVSAVFARVRGSVHKRLFPPVPKLGIRTVGVDLREEYQGRAD